MNTDFEHIQQLFIQNTTLYGGRAIIAVLIFIIGRKFITHFTRLLTKKMGKGGFDKDIQPFILSLISAGLNILLLLTVANTLGVETTSFVAIIGAASLAVGLALQGSLSNFAGGVLILIFKPFRVGDVINSQGFTGLVESIQMINTVLATSDGKVIILPNGLLATSALTNISTKGQIRMDVQILVAYQNNSKKVKAILEKVAADCPLRVPESASEVFISKITESVVWYEIRIWSVPEESQKVPFYINENVKLEFELHKIEPKKSAIEPE